MANILTRLKSPITAYDFVDRGELKIGMTFTYDGKKYTCPDGRNIVGEGTSIDTMDYLIIPEKHLRETTNFLKKLKLVQ